MNKLAEQFPLAARFVERITAADATYGSQQHQVDFVERAHDMQALHPCAEEHEHSGKCYPNAVVDAVAQAQVKRRRAE